MAKLTIVPPVAPPVYVLELTEAEAKVVLTLTGRVSGSAVGSNRKHADSVYYALSEAFPAYYDPTLPDFLAGFKDL